MAETVIAGLLAGYGIAIPVGAIGVLIITLAARTSLRIGFAAGMGTATADGLYAVLAATAGTAMAALIRPISEPMRWVAAIILAGIGIKGVYDAFRRRSAASVAAPDVAVERPLGTYLKMVGLTLLNPLTVIYFAALVVALRNDSWTAINYVVFVVAAFVASASWQSLLAVGGAVIGRVLNTARGRLVTAVVGNGVILALAVHLIIA